MAYTYLLKMTGISGESEIEQHENEIEIDEFNEVFRNTDPLDELEKAELEKVRPYVHCSGLTIKKRFDHSIPNMLSCLTEGKRIKEATITCSGAENAQFLAVELSDVTVDEVRLDFKKEHSEITVNFSYNIIEYAALSGTETKSQFRFKKTND